MKYLGLDFGLKHIGMAVADGPLAEPLGQTEAESPAKLLTLIKNQQPHIIVLGLPEGRLASHVEALGDFISTSLGLKVVYQDETLSTQEAQAKLLEAGKPQKKRRLDHAAAATVILQAYLDDHYQS